jgi:hypothetical protein
MFMMKIAVLRTLDRGRIVALTRPGGSGGNSITTKADEPLYLRPKTLAETFWETLKIQMMSRSDARL